jgi:hypothetical protein
VIIFRLIEGSGRLHVCGNRAAESPGCFESCLGCARGLLLFGRMEKDYAPVLRPDIRTLAIHLRGIVRLPEHVQKLIVADFVRIILDLDDFGMTGPISTDILICWIGSVPAFISR